MVTSGRSGPPSIPGPASDPASRSLLRYIVTLLGTKSRRINLTMAVPGSDLFLTRPTSRGGTTVEILGGQRSPTATA
jgi:hypothetical protein